MKKLIIILGANGIGKSTTAIELMRILPNSAFIDSDSLRMMNPAGNSAELIQIQKSNILAVMSNYFASDMIENIIFPYGIHGHRKQLLDEIVEDICKKYDIEIYTIVLVCSEAENIRRMKLDNRDDERIKRALLFSRPVYNNIDHLKLDITELEPKNAALAIIDALGLDDIYKFVDKNENLIEILSDTVMYTEAEKRMVANDDRENISHKALLDELGISEADLSSVNVDIE